MDYEKAYKDALNRAKHALDCHNQGMVSTDVSLITSMFPELKESKDERIKKWLIGYFHQYKEDGMEKYANGLKVESIITWLEKQGDSPIKWNKNTKDCKPKVSHSVLMKTTHGIAEGEWQGEHWHQYRWAGLVRDTDVLSWMELSNLEKQSEQKPTIEMKSAEESLGIDSDTYNEIVDECIYGEQKYWSEEDEKMVDNILTPLATKCPFEIYQPMYNWLKSLKQRIGGLTDFDVIGEVVQRNLLEEVVKQMSDTLPVETLLYRKKQGTLSIFYGERKEGLERFLKSICTWKPSDEQMATLYKYAEQNNYDGSILTSLYNDLKKLREE